MAALHHTQGIRSLLIGHYEQEIGILIHQKRLSFLFQQSSLEDRSLI
jgi:hypothetical protein